MELSELKPFREQRAADRAVERFSKLEAIRQVGNTLSELRADPRWEVYGRYIEQERAKNEASAKAQERALLDMVNPMPALDELKAKLRLAHNQGAMEAYKVALEIAKTLIEQGEKAEALIAQMGKQV